MKQIFYITFLFAALGLTSCSKDNKIDISQLGGDWFLYNDDPRLSIDGSVRYSFLPPNSCHIHVYDALSNRDTTLYRSYVLSLDHTLITLYSQGNTYTDQYHILKLTSREMFWENASPEDGNSNKKLRKTD